MAGRLTEHISVDEVKCRGKRCCGGSYPMDWRVMEAFELIRAELGDIPLNIGSGFRCLTHNRNIASEDTSQHTLGRAIDIHANVHVDAQMLKDAAWAVRERYAPLKGIGLYKWGVHIDVRDGDRVSWGDT